MSDFTSELRFICETEAGLSESKGYNSIADIIDQARPKIFNFDYPIFDENHREELETKIIRHFYTREIGLETYGLWKLKLETRMNEIMPYYNEMYKTAAIEYNPIHDVDYVKTHAGTNEVNTTSKTMSASEGTSERDISSTSTGSTSNDTTSWDLYNDTPQGSVQNIENETYLTNARKNTEDYDGTTTNTSTTNDDTQYTDNRTVDGTNKETGTDNYIETMKGKVGTYSFSKMIKEYREQVLNIDMMIINDLENLFMLLW